jgi:hypothetical protein
VGSYAVVFDLERPARFDRGHVVLRLLILVVLSWLVGWGGGLGLVYLAVPVVAAILISQKGGERYLAEDGDRVSGWLAFLIGVLAYLALLTDQLPGGGRRPLRFEVAVSGSPTVGSALLRLVTAIPISAITNALGIVGWLVWLIAAIWVLVSEQYPEGLWRFQRGLIRWQAQLLGYLASLVQPYPPFSFDTGPAS